MAGCSCSSCHSHGEEANEIGLKAAFLILGGISLAVSFFDIFSTNIGNYKIDAAWGAILLCGVPIIKNATVGLVTEFDIKADVLVSLALVAAVVTGEVFAAGEVAFIMQIGALLEEMTVAKARSGIEKLAKLKAPVARIVKDGACEIISADFVKVGDTLRVIPGEIIAADGVIISGRTSIDQSVMTGESMPVDKTEGENVLCGTVNLFGSFDMIASKVGEDSSLQRMIRLVQSVDADKAKIVGIADRFATWVVVAALTSAIATWFATGEIIRSVTILVVFCPCALVLATPTAIMAAIGNAAGRGILVREGDALERIASVNLITFDKTGTLTQGKPEVVKVKSIAPCVSDEAVYEAAASAELRSEHPLGKSLVDSYKRDTGKIPKEPKSFSMIPGRGVKAVLEDKQVLAGNEEFLKESGVNLTCSLTDKDIEKMTHKGATIVYIAVDGIFAGFLALSDILRENAKESVAHIEKLGVVPVLLTGDRKDVASYIADAAGISSVYSDCLPEEKLKIIEDLGKSWKYVCMVGDGVNDAPALKKANVGIAMGGIGSDIAVDAADIVLVRDDIAVLPHLLALSKRMMATIKLNMGFAMGLNFIAIILAMFGVLGPVLGALVHNAGSVLVIINSIFLLKWQESK